MEKNLSYYGEPIVKFLAFYLFVFACVFPFALIANFNWVATDQMNPLVFELASQAIAILVVLGALLMAFQTFKAYNFNQVLIGKNNIFSGFVKGALIGFALIIICAGLALLSGNVVFNLIRINWVAVSAYGLLFVLVGIFEEFLFRTFALVVLAERYPVPIAILVPNVLFGLAHFASPGFNWLALLNIILAGALLSIIILLKRNVFWAVGLHFGWNFTQGVLLGYKVSGTASPGIVQAKSMGSVYLSGGEFGIESSVYCSGVLLVVIIFLLIKFHIEPIKESEVKELIEEF